MELLLMPLLKALFFCTAITVAIVSTAQIRHPKTRKSDQVDDYHGVKVADPYRWLEETDSPETKRWIEEQNRVTFGHLSRLPDRDRIRSRLTEFWNYPRFGLPFKRAGLYFYMKNDGLQNQDVLYFQESLRGDPRVLLDPNTLSEDGTVALTGYTVSEDGKLLAYAIAREGSDWQEVRIRDIETGKDLPDELKWIKWSGMAWTHDHRGFFYSRYPPPGKAAFREVNHDHKVYYHVVGRPQSEDSLVYERPDRADWSLHAVVTEDGRYLIVYLNEGTDPRDRIYYFELDDAKNPTIPTADARPQAASEPSTIHKLLDDFDANYGFIGNEGPVFYFRTDLDAPRARVIAIDTRRPARDQWRTVIPQDSDTLQGVSLARDQLITTYLRSAHSEVRFFDLRGKLLKKLRLPTIGTAGGFGGRREETERFYSFSSFLYPPTIFRYDMKTGRSSVFRKAQIGFDFEPYETKQVFYRSKDGTRIPMFIMHRKGLKLDGSNPTFLYGYGGFNSSMTPGFAISRLIWMQSGGVYAIPNLRGGGEFGEDWHKAGTVQRKQNVFDDFIAAAEYLIREGYTSPKKLVISGGSNGGLLVGAAMTQRPDLFAVVLPAVGVMDMLRYHKFTIGWMWKSDYGTSEDSEQFKTLYRYSPLHNLKPGVRYPATLVTTGDHDDRVVPGHSFKFGARLQEVQAGDAPVLIRIEIRAGHGAGKPTAKMIDEAADVWAFALHWTR